jgi:ankyrin repeat protein
MHRTHVWRVPGVLAAVVGVSLGAVISLGAAGAGGGTTLIDAVKVGNRAAVRTLLTATTVKSTEADGMTALHWAVRGDDLDTVQLLIKAGANVSAANRYGITPLSLAATNGNPAIARALLKAGANPNAPGPDGETVLMTAARAGNADIVNALIERGVNVNATETWQGQTALMWAAAENHGAVIKALGAHGVDLNARSKELAFPDYRYETNGMAVFQLPKGGWTALMYAARQNSMEAVAALADVHADLNATTKQEGTTALQIAVINIHYDLANLLLERGADPNVVDASGMTALYAAVDMRAPANLLTRPEPKLRDALDAVGVVKSLLAHGADPNIQLKKPIIGRHQNLVGDGQLTEGATALARASKTCDVPMMKVLLDGGADATLALTNRTTTAMLASGGNAPEPKVLEAVTLLVGHGVDVDAFNANGQTILHNAAQRGHNSVVEYVAGKGAKLDRRDKQGRTPLDLARGAGSGGRRQGRPATAPVVNEKTAALLVQLMQKP